MNERIRKLAEQAGMMYHSEHQYDNFDEQKFARLIVRECLEQIYSMTIDDPMEDWDQGYDSGLDQAAETIKTHFGVEE